jgi:mevalonate pyrophosphate decarboxylase
MGWHGHQSEDNVHRHIKVINFQRENRNISTHTSYLFPFPPPLQIGWSSSAAVAAAAAATM